MNRQPRIQTAPTHLTGSRTLRALIASGVLAFASSAFNPILAGEVPGHPNDPGADQLQVHYVEPSDGPAYDLDSLMRFSREITESIAAASWSANSQPAGPQNDWFNIRPRQDYETDTTLIPIREDGDFGGAMLNFEVKY